MEIWFQFVSEVNKVNNTRGSLNFLEQLKDTQGLFWFVIGQALCNLATTLIYGEENWGATIIFLFAQFYVSIFKMYVLKSLGGFFFSFSFLVWFLFCFVCGSN